MFQRFQQNWLHWSLQRHALHAWVAGACFALCFAPFHAVPLLFVAVPSLVALLAHAQTRRRAMLLSFMFGYGFFMVGTYWIAFSLLVDSAAHGWLIPFSVLGLSALMALWFGPFGLLMHHVRQRPFAEKIVVFIAAWVALEWLRGQGMFGFPWNLAGYIAGISDNLSQLAAPFGIYGLSVVVLLVALAPTMYMQLQARKWRAASMVGLLLLVGAAYMWGGNRMPDKVAYSDTYLRIVQPNIPQAMKWSPEGKIMAFRQLRKLSTKAEGAVPPNIVIWPETAIPFVVHGQTNWQALMDKFVPKGTSLITGVLRQDETNGATYNSVAVVNSAYQTIFYDKHQLVPFGEFIPFREWLPFLPITQMGGNFSRSAGPVTLRPDHMPPFSPLICYEAVFPHFSIDGDDKPAWLLNVTNDAWFGQSPGPYQHLEMVRFRAIEQGLPLIRVANTGISAVIDPYGRVIQRVPLGEEGSIHSFLPKPITK